MIGLGSRDVDRGISSVAACVNCQVLPYREKFYILRPFAISAVAILGLSVAAQANEFEGPLRSLAEGELAAWATNDTLLEAVRAQNAAHEALTQADIDSMDQDWRAQVGAGAAPLIDDLLARPGSEWLRGKKEESAGLITEVFVTDNRGLNVVQSDVTFDYWQGDEAKWSETYGKPAGTIHFGDIELGESTQTYQSQISIPVIDPATNVALGAVTFGINLEYLQ